MKTSNLFTLCLLLLTAAGVAAQERAVRGRIANPDGEAVPYCTVSLRRAADSTILAGVISDSLGRYRLAPLAEDGCFLEFAHLLNFSCRNIVATDNKVRTWNMERSFLQNRRHRGRTAYTFSITFLFNNYKGNKDISRTSTLQNMSNEYK